MFFLTFFLLSIYVMNNGTVIEQGKHDDLLNIKGGAYAAMVESQNLAAGEGANCGPRGYDIDGNKVNATDVVKTPANEESEDPLH